MFELQPQSTALAYSTYQDVAASCIFLATKTEECGRKLVDVAKVYQAKVQSLSDPNKIPSDGQVLLFLPKFKFPDIY